MYAFDTLHTRRSPSFVCTASISDFCLADEACQARLTIGDGPLEVVRLCKIVNLGCTVAINNDPFWYLYAPFSHYDLAETHCRRVHKAARLENLPNCKSSAIRGWCDGRYSYLVQRSCRYMF